MSDTTASTKPKRPRRKPKPRKNKSAVEEAGEPMKVVAVTVPSTRIANKNKQIRVRKLPTKDEALCSWKAVLPVNCSICEDKICYLVCGLRRLPCGHGFGEICIDAWIRENERCPTCYLKVDHKSFFEPPLNYTRRSHLYNKAIMNANVKIGFSGAVAGSFVAGGELVSKCLERAAHVASDMITAGATEGIEKNRYNDNYVVKQLDNDELMDLKRNVERVKTVVGATAKVTGCVATVFGAGLWALGSMLAPAVSHGSKALLTKFDVSEEQANRMVDGAMELAKGAMLSTGQMLRGFEHAGTVVASSAAGNVARIYEVRHGLEPGELSYDAVAIAKDVTATAWNVRAFPPSSLANISRNIQKPYQPAETVSSAMQIEYGPM